MEAAVHGPFAVFRTLFTPEYDLTQCFLGACTPTDHFTAPVDIHYAALLRHDTRDIWHIDRALSLCTDEAPPFLVCGEDLGGHHTPDTAVLLRADGSRFMQKHIGLVWKDEAGIPWTCINITPEGEGLFQGKADGSLQSGFRFPEAPHGRLTGSSGSFLPVSCRMHRSMGTLVRHTKRRITLRMGRKYVPLTDGSASCDEARMEECFEVVDPLTWAARLHAMRPQGGYEHGLPPAALGETLFSADMVHTLSGDGTWVTRFSLRAEKPAAWQGYLGLMTQERCCP